jgi:esterase
MARTAFGDSRRVIVPDLRNHGQSPHAPEMSYPSMADDVEDLWDTLDLESSDVIGHSMGGKVAMELALASPERVSRLVVVDIAPRAYEARNLDLLAALKRIHPASHGTRSLVRDALSHDVADPGVLQFLMKNLRRTDAGSFEWLVNLEAIEASYRALSGGLQAFATFKGPALFVRGGRSDYVRDEDFEVIRAYFPVAEIMTIEGAGHWVHADAAEEFVGVVEGFLQA